MDTKALVLGTIITEISTSDCSMFITKSFSFQAFVSRQDFIQAPRRPHHGLDLSAASLVNQPHRHILTSYKRAKSLPDYPNQSST